MSKLPPSIPASLSRAAGSSRLKAVRDGPSLDFFITRSRVLALYREIQRTLKDVANPRDRKDLQDWARSDFERYRHETNPDKIKSLISQGKHQFHSLQTNLVLSSGKKQAKDTTTHSRPHSHPHSHSHSHSHSH